MKHTIPKHNNNLEGFYINFTQREAVSVAQDYVDMKVSMSANKDNILRDLREHVYRSPVVAWQIEDDGKATPLFFVVDIDVKQPDDYLVLDKITGYEYVYKHRMTEHEAVTRLTKVIYYYVSFAYTEIVDKQKTPAFLS